MYVLTLILVWLALVISIGYGYIHNIVLLATHAGAFGICEVLRLIGIFVAPLGVVLGYIS